MARPKATPEQRRGQRDRIRRAAADVYRRDGLSGITVRAVSAAAGVSAGTLYSYFGSIEELMQSLWTEPVAEVNRRLEQTVDGIADPLERIRALLEAYVRFAGDQPEVFRGAVLFVRPATAPAPTTQPPDDLPFHRLLREAVEDGQATDVVRQGDAATIAQVLWAGVHGAVALPINIDRFSLEAPAVLARGMIDALLTSLTPVTADA